MIESLPIKDKLDLRGVPCPLNYVRLSLVLEKLSPKDILQVEIDRGDPEDTIMSGVNDSGHQIKILKKDINSISFLVICGNE